MQLWVQEKRQSRAKSPRTVQGLSLPTPAPHMPTCTLRPPEVGPPALHSTPASSPCSICTHVVGATACMTHTVAVHGASCSASANFGKQTDRGCKNDPSPYQPWDPAVNVSSLGPSFPLYTMEVIIMPVSADYSSDVVLMCSQDLF